MVDTGLAEIKEMQEAIEAMEGGARKATPKSKKLAKVENTVHSLLK